MTENTKIEWADHTFNPWIGCTKVSGACDHCYAEAWDNRFHGERWGPHAVRTRTKTWGKPLVWDRKAKEAGERHKVFCASLADVGDNHRSISQEWRDELRELVAQTPNLIWLFLTKRPQNIARFYPQWMDRWPDNVWIGTTVENQIEADRRIPDLLELPAPVRFLSCEPLLGPVDLTNLDPNIGCGKYCAHGCTISSDYECGKFCPQINWVICGGESGPGARPMHPDWARSLRDQCNAAGVPFFFKQWGEWVEDKPQPGGDLGSDTRTGKVCFVQLNREPDGHFRKGDKIMRRIGKKAAGRLLDGREWNEVPG